VGKQGRLGTNRRGAMGIPIFDKGSIVHELNGDSHKSVDRYCLLGWGRKEKSVVNQLRKYAWVLGHYSEPRKDQD